MPIVYGGLLPKAYGTRSMDAQRCANALKPLKQVFYSRKESKTTTLTKSKPYSHVLTCSGRFNDLLWRGLCTKETRSLHIIIIDFPSVVSFLIELYKPLRSVSLI